MKSEGDALHELLPYSVFQQLFGVHLRAKQRQQPAMRSSWVWKEAGGETVPESRAERSTPPPRRTGIGFLPCPSDPGQMGQTIRTLFISVKLMMMILQHDVPKVVGTESFKLPPILVTSINVKSSFSYHQEGRYEGPAFELGAPPLGCHLGAPTAMGANSSFGFPPCARCNNSFRALGMVCVIREIKYESKSVI